jgi:hypothetical protein
VYLSDELAAQVQASGLRIAELIRRGLGTISSPLPEADGGDILAVLLRIEATMNNALGRLAPDDESGDVIELSDEELAAQEEEQERQHEERQRMQAARFRDRLLAGVEPGRSRVMNSSDAAVILHCSNSAALDRLRLMESHKLAERADDGTAPYHWRIHAA